MNQHLVALSLAAFFSSSTQHTVSKTHISFISSALNYYTQPTIKRTTDPAPCYETVCKTDETYLTTSLQKHFLSRQYAIRRIFLLLNIHSWANASQARVAFVVRIYIAYVGACILIQLESWDHQDGILHRSLRKIHTFPYKIEHDSCHQMSSEE